MGNSGSVHHMQSGLKELHSYYQVQGNAEGIEDLAFLNSDQRGPIHEEHNRLEREKSLPRSKFSRIPSTTRHSQQAEAAARNSQVKVLPNLTEHLRLRSTTNGAILQSGGTISGRKESLLPQPMVLERSKTFIHEKPGEALGGGGAMRPMLTRRSQTQLSIDLKRNSIPNAMQRGQPQDNGAHYKRYSSNLSLKESPAEVLEAASVSNSSETNQKLSKVKIKNKKRKAPPVPPTSSDGSKLPQEGRAVNQQSHDFGHKELERKQRIFKTKSETIFHASVGSLSRQQQAVEQKSPAKPVAAEKAKVILRPKTTKPPSESTAFRREKSFDATLLSSRNKGADCPAGRDSCTGSTKRKSLQLSVAPLLSSKCNFKAERSDFKIELEAATKSRFATKTLHLSEFRTSSKEASARQREPNAEKTTNFQPKTTQKATKPETQSKIPQLKKTFYFGMEASKRKQDDSSQKAPKPVAGEATASPSEDDMDCSPVYTVGQKYSSEINDNGIQVNVRPTLPRRQLEIPRFSPIAAWRTLTEEYRKQSLEATESPHSSNSALEAANTVLMEDRIYRTYREPCPFYPDNKSGDSGISGDDAFLPEKPIQPRNLIQVQNECDELLAIGKLDESPVDDALPPLKVVGPFLTPWTPQQDLDEEDTSSDGDLAMKIVESRSPISAHVFSLSLPRENQISLYGEKSKPEFRSLQKLKRSASGEFNTSACECTQSSDSNACNNSCLGNYRSDNWLLSKTGTAPNAAADKSAASCNPTEAHTKGSFMDWSVSIQPMSLGCLATGKHLMYLPNRPMHELKRQSVVVPPISSLDEANSKNTRTRNKRFSFQSSVRQIERRRLAEKLSKDAEQKEALRKSELEVMRRVEEEFQRKRAYEKASIRHQLRLYSMDDDNFASLPTDYTTTHCDAYRAEPDGAVSSTSDSPVLRTRDDTKYPDNEYRRNSCSKLGNDLAMIFANS